jgi:DNA-binding CsgD family transcriptional regulator/tetratricopeptide (TPR) repeat protein
MRIDLDRARASYERGAWTDAYESLRRADEDTPLDGDDLHRLGVAAYLIGQEAEFETYFDRLHRRQSTTGDRTGAARSAFWLSLSLWLRGHAAQSTAWAARGLRMVEDVDCVEKGYIALMPAERLLRDGDVAAALAASATGLEIGERFGDADLIALARHLQARALVERGDVALGLDLLDETMLPVVAGELFPIATGLLYCSVIETCQNVYAASRAREWTLAFARWCDRQREALAFSGTCLAHRAEILQLHGEWREALDDTMRACDCAARASRKPPAAALYQRGEIYRLRGEHGKADEAYRAASERGCDPQPGLALLRAAQGQMDAACAMIRRGLQTTTDRLRRARLLSASIDVLLAAGAIDEAHEVCRELNELAEALEATVLRSFVAQGLGAIHLARGDASAAVGPLRRAFELWTRLDAPYDAARARVQIGRAYRALGDEETAALEIGAARATFAKLGARLDLSQIDELEPAHGGGGRGKLSSREQEVIRLIAGGHTNKGIAMQLGVSERTVDRHVSNILTKLDVPSRTAATAYAYQHGLL